MIVDVPNKSFSIILSNIDCSSDLQPARLTTEYPGRLKCNIPSLLLLIDQSARKEVIADWITRYGDIIITEVWDEGDGRAVELAIGSLQQQ